MEDDFQLFSSLRYDPALLRVPGSGLRHAGWNWANSSALYMLDYHRDRMLRAAAHWGWDAAVEVLRGDSGLDRLKEFIMSSVGEAQLSPKRIRIAITREGVLSLSSGSVPETPLVNLFPEQLPSPDVAHCNMLSAGTPQKSPEYEVLLDDQKTTWSEHCHFKTTKRAVYDRARQRAQIGLHDKKEVLIVDGENRTVMEGSITTPYFWRNGRWTTPAVSKVNSVERGMGGQDGTSRRWALERGIAVEGEIAAGSLLDGEECWLSNGVRGFFFGRIKLK